MGKREKVKMVKNGKWENGKQAGAELCQTQDKQRLVLLS
jgi:hypothetical protein